MTITGRRARSSSSPARSEAVWGQGTELERGAPAERGDDSGVDAAQGDRGVGWYRHITLSMLAHAFPSVTRSKKRDQIQADPT
ncbi:hypothetical protein [Rathayibacter soli]|uniref:hypothetical protein n=1 Tax=Rathayibacter soli TaxID=3144168 RepID=UPI0027E456AD|nr:hypothetical protein [Glaciibacter superstes]